MIYVYLSLKTKDENFGIVELQTNDILNIRIEIFMKKREKEIIKAKFKANNQTILEISIFRDFNSCHITIGIKSIMVVLKN